MPNQEEAPSSGVGDYRNRLRAKNSVDYSYKKRKIRYVNPFAKVIQEKKSKVVRTTKNVNHSSSKRKMNYINPYAVESKRKKVEAYQSRSRNVAVESRNEMIKSVDRSMPIKKEEDLSYNFRSRKVVNYSLTKRRANYANPLKTEKTDDCPVKSEPKEDNTECSSTNNNITEKADDCPVKSEPNEDDTECSSTNNNITEKTDDCPVKSEPNKDNTVCSSTNNNISIKKDVFEVDKKLVNSILNDWASSDDSGDDSTPVNVVGPHSSQSVVIETGRAENCVLQVENGSNSVKSDELNQMSTTTLNIITESSEDCETHLTVGESVEDDSDDVQFIPKPVQIIIIDDDDEPDIGLPPHRAEASCEDDNVVKLETKQDLSLNSVVIDMDSCEKTETKITPDEMPQGISESYDLLSNAKSEPYEPKYELDECVIKDEWQNIDWIVEISNMTDSLESLFRDRNTLEEPNFSFLNMDYVRRCAWEIENKYRQFEVYSYEGVGNEVGGIEELTEEQLEHPYYKNHHPQPELSEYEKEEIELEKDRICEEASGFNNHLWRRPLNGGPFAQTNKTPIPRCPEFINAFTPAGQHIAMKTDADRPAKFRSDWDRRLWDFATIFNFNRYREDIEEGHYLPASADRQLESSILQLNKSVRTYFNRNRRELLPFEKMLLLNELKLLYWDKCIKTCLPELEKLAVSLLDEILEAPVYVFTMIKFVLIFVTIKKVMLQKRYPALRSKATLLYEKIKGNAILNEGQSLEDYIFPRSKILHNHYKNASIFELIRLDARTATKSIIKKISDTLEGKEEEEEEVEFEGDNAIDDSYDDDSDDSDDEGDDDDDDDDDNDSDEEEDDDDNGEDDDDNDDGYSGTYDEVGSSSSSSYDSDSDRDVFFEDSDDSSSSSSSEDEAMMDGVIREE